MKLFSLWRTVERYYEAEVDYGTLKFLNKFYLLLLLLYYIGLFKYVAAMFGSDGIYGYDFLSSVSESYTTYDYDTHKYWQILSQLTSPGTIYLVYTGLLVLLVSSLLNFFPVVTGVIALLLHCLFAVRSNLSYWGWGFMVTPYLIYTFFGMIRNSGPVWPIRLLQLNIATLYLHIVLHRIGDVSWANGNMLFETLNQSMFFRFPINWDPYQEILRLMTYFALAVEIAAPVCLLTGFFRRLAIALLIIFHLGLELLTNVGFWNVMLIPSLLVFLRPEEQKRILDFLYFLPATATDFIRNFLKKRQPCD